MLPLLPFALVAVLLAGTLHVPSQSAAPAPADPPAQDQPGAASGSLTPPAAGAANVPAAGSAPVTAAELATARAAADAAAAHAAGEALLDAAARFQRGDQPRGTPVSLHGRFYVGVRDDEGSMLKATVERWYTAQPERLLTHRTETLTGSASSVCYDAGTAWFHDDASGQVVVYSDAPEIHDVDLDFLAEQRRLTKLLLQAAVLDALRPRLTDVVAIGERQIKDLEGATHAVGVVRAQVLDELFEPPAAAPPPAPDDPPRRLELVLVIDRDSGALWELTVSAVGRAEVQPLRLHFDFHGETRTGLRVPGNIKVFRGAERLEALNLGVELDADGKLIFDVDAPMDATVFARPAG